MNYTKLYYAVTSMILSRGGFSTLNDVIWLLILWKALGWIVGMQRTELLQFTCSLGDRGLSPSLHSFSKDYKVL